jgi:DGQHR domain-containing protein
MLTVPALKIRQFGQDFFLLNLAAADVERLVRFEVLGGSGIQGAGAVKRRGAKPSLVNWNEIEQKVQTSEKAYQRPILRKKVDELAAYYLQCKDDGAVPAIPGPVLLTTEQPVTFLPQGGNPFVGLLEISDEEGTLRVLDGQHRLLALAALLMGGNVSEDERAAASLLQVPAVLFSNLTASSVVEMFVTINSKHTRLNSSLLFELKGRQLYADPIDARVHDVIKKLNAEGSPLAGEIKMLGIGPGKVAQSGLAQELKRIVLALQKAHSEQPWLADFMAHVERFYLVYFKEIAKVLADAWQSGKHSTRSLIALRAFLQVSESVVPKVMQAGGDPRVTLHAILSPWTDRIGAARFETAGAWRANVAGGGKETTRRLARELLDHLGGTTP